MIPVALLLLWGYAVFRLGPLWYSYPDYAYGWFVPILCAALFRERWQARPARDVSRPAGGTYFLLALFGLALLPAALALEVMPEWRFAGWALALPLVGITVIGLYLLGGRRWSRHFLFPVLFFLIAVPWPTRMELPLIDRLSHLNAAGSTLAANLLGTPAVRQGTLIETGAGLVGIDDACSGIRSFQASVMVALFLGELFGYGFFKRLIFLAGGAALALGCNLVRTTYLVRISDLHGLGAVKLHHDQAGFVILGVTLAGLLVLAWLLRKRGHRSDDDDLPEGWQPLPERRREEDQADELPPASARWIVFARPALAGLLVWILVFEAGIELWFRAGEQPARQMAGWKFQLPAGNSEFTSPPIPEATREMLSYDVGQTAQWRDEGGRPWQLYYLRWLPAANRYRASVTCQAARGHAPDVCLKNQGMTLQTNLGPQILEIKGTQLRVTMERFVDHGRLFHVATCYWEPRRTALEDGPSGTASTAYGFRLARHSFALHDRGRSEKRVLKIGAWDMANDEAARAAILACLRAMVST